MTFSDKIKELRKEKGVSQDIASKKMNMAISSLRNYENGRLPDTEQLRKIQQYYNVPYEFLLNDNCTTKEYNNMQVSKELGLSDEAISNLKKFQMVKVENSKSNNNISSTIDLINNMLENIALLGFLNSYISINNCVDNYDTNHINNSLNNLIEDFLGNSDIDFSNKKINNLNTKEILKTSILNMFTNELDKLSNK